MNTDLSQRLPLPSHAHCMHTRILLPGPNFSLGGRILRSIRGRAANGLPHQLLRTTASFPPTLKVPPSPLTPSLLLHRLVNVKNIDLRTKILGHPSSFPVYITATALGKLAHPEGEVVLTRAAHAQGVIQMCPTLASCTVEEMTEAAQPGQVHAAGLGRTVR